MGCFFGCFGVKDSRSIPISSPEPAVPRSNNALSSLFMSDDQTIQKRDEGRNPVLRRLNVKELKDEVKFTKSFGASLQDEIQTDSEKEIGKTAQSREGNSTKLSSWFSNASTDNLKEEKQFNGSPIAVENREDHITGSSSFMESPSSCMTDRHNNRRISSGSNQRSVQDAITPFTMHGSETHSQTSSVSHPPFTPRVKSAIESVHFVRESNQSGFSSEGSSSECVSHSSKPPGLDSGNNILTKLWPCPTPLKLTDEMHTPGTEFSAYKDDASIRKIPNKSSFDHFRESPKLDDEETLIATPMLGPAAKHDSVDKDSDDDGSLSSWFKPVSVKQDGHNKRFESVSSEKVTAKTPGERPILGMVAAYWNEDEPSQVPPKWWDGNGIPNSTNKYKEDQKVSWHATPFEERLEKALSEETSVSQRKPVSTVPAVDFNEAEDTDTALSRLQSESHTKPVVSF